MSDFLTNLVARSFGPAPNLLRPKLPSLFEVPAGNGPTQEESVGMNAHKEIAEKSVSPAVMDHPHLERRGVIKSDHGTPPHVEPRRGTPESNHAARRTILPSMREEEQMRAPIRIQYEDHAVAAPTVGAVENLSERKQATSLRVEAVAKSVRKTDEAESSQRIVSRLVPFIPRLEPPRLVSEAEDSVDAKIFPSEEQSPAVRISIGRIEVRAVTQPSLPAQPVVPNRPQMTLDEYLLRRNEGRR